MQTTDHILMVRPIRFAFNEETASNNAFQQKSDTEEAAHATALRAVVEFDSFVSLLRENGVTVEVLQDTPEPFTPDSIFPNNCFSTHLEGGQRTLVLYPMYAPNRRLERAKLRQLLDKMPFDRVVDLTHLEKGSTFLEGTGSLILDRERHLAYACLSPRTHPSAVEAWAREMGYRCFLFHSEDENGMAVYHTNVVMHVGSRMAVVCLDSIKDEEERRHLRSQLEESGKHVVAISYEQMHHFAGNMLEVRNDKGEALLVMSTTALESLTPEQKEQIEQYVRIIAAHIPSIETAGGGSARCMMAEIF